MILLEKAYIRTYNPAPIIGTMNQVRIVSCRCRLDIHFDLPFPLRLLTAPRTGCALDSLEPYTAVVSSRRKEVSKA